MEFTSATTLKEDKTPQRLSFADLFSKYLLIALCVPGSLLSTKMNNHKKEEPIYLRKTSLEW